MRSVLLLTQHQGAVKTTYQFEGASILMKPDTITPLNDLIKRLDGNWRFTETGKMYWIGYTADMFSIAAKGDSAIDLLIKLVDDTSHSIKARLGAVYTLHLIGINRQVKGRFYEEFVNIKARKGLLYALKYPELREEIISVL